MITIVRVVVRVVVMIYKIINAKDQAFPLHTISALLFTLTPSVLSFGSGPIFSFSFAFSSDSYIVKTRLPKTPDQYIFPFSTIGF